MVSLGIVNNRGGTIMNVDNVFEYFYGRKGKQLVVGEGKEVKLITVRKGDISLDEMILGFKYRNNEIAVYISKPRKEELRLQFNKNIPGLQVETYTPVEKLDSTLLIYLGKFVEEADKELKFKLFDWRG